MISENFWKRLDMRYKMPKLIHATFLKDEEHCVEMMLKSILQWVDASYILIDDRTTDRTREICLDHGCHIMDYTFENFGKFRNKQLSWINDKSDWIFGLTADEMILEEFGQQLKPLVEKIHGTDIEGARFPRRHWYDLERKKERKEWYPDWQLRIIKNGQYPRIHYHGYVHEVPIGVRKALMIQNLEVHHFNCYWKPRIKYNWDEMNNLYNKLKIKQQAEGMTDIWPND
jgi:glycosyltransferase involved in cell wall biosynthesis